MAITSPPSGSMSSVMPFAGTPSGGPSEPLISSTASRIACALAPSHRATRAYISTSGPLSNRPYAPCPGASSPIGSAQPTSTPERTVSTETTPLDHVLVADREHWEDGPPHELFAQMRSQCPVHWSPSITDYPDEAGFWSVTRADDVHAVSRDWETYSSFYGITGLTHAILPLELQQAMFIGMDPPKHDRLKNLFQRGFTPRRIAEHEGTIREITRGVLDRLEGRETCELVTEVAQPIVSRVIGSFMGIPPEDDEIWARLMNSTLGAGDTDITPEGAAIVMQRDVPEIFARCNRLIAERRENPTDDRTSALVHADAD